jgi:hypothetical protein
MANENQNQSHLHEVTIAVMQKDVEYIKNSIGKIETTLAVFDRNFARKDELKELEKTIIAHDKELKEGLGKFEKTIKEGLASKTDNKDFEPFKKTMQRINWMVIATAIGALLNLIIKTQ